jgi:predicted amidohydrolase
MKVLVESYQLSKKFKNHKDWFDNFENKLVQSCKLADVVLMPELLWLDLLQFDKDLKQHLLAQLGNLSKLVWEKYLPDFLIRNTKLLKGKFLVLGTAPRIKYGKLYNSAVVIHQQKICSQDKIYLTPWEKQFTAGKEFKIFIFNKMKIAIPICFDIEHPLLAENLKHHVVDLLLVPSATSDDLGNQRILRCASARSVELGCCTIAVPLLGSADCELIDFNTGVHGYFLPSQLGVEKFLPNNIFSGEIMQSNLYEVPVKWIKALKGKNSNNETRPFAKSNPKFKVNLQ